MQRSPEKSPQPAQRPTQQEATQPGPSSSHLTPPNPLSGQPSALPLNLPRSNPQERDGVAHPLVLGEKRNVVTPGSIHDGRPLPYSESGERYQSLPYVEKDKGRTVNLVGLSRRNGKFEVFDISGKVHRSLGLLDKTNSEDPVVTDPVRLPGGGNEQSRSSREKSKHNEPGDGTPRHGQGNPLASSSSAVTREYRSSANLDSIINSLNTTARNTRPITRANIENRDRPIPPHVYRATRESVEEVLANGIERAGDPPASDDEYLAKIIQHSARTGGSGGSVPSLSANRATSGRFLASNPTMVRIDTGSDPEGFRTMANIILHDAERLIQEGHVTAGTVARAISNLVDENEAELFYVRGDIPPSLISDVKTPTSRR